MLPPQRRLMSFCNIITNSRKLVPLLLLTVACAREPRSSVHVEPEGSMMSEPNAPLFECLIGSDDERPVAPNSIGVAMPASVAGSAVTSPAYHWYVMLVPGAAVWTGLRPTFMPSERVTS